MTLSLIRTLFLSGLFALPAAAQEIATARDAYLEAWFQETAENDLEQALQLYRRCVELGQTTDPELAAKALWRTGRIARARGDEDAAQAAFEQVLQRFSQTQAAKSAAADRAGAPAQDGSPAGEAVETARQLLQQMLLDESKISTQWSQIVFGTLAPDQVAEMVQRYPSHFAAVLRKGTQADIVRFAERSDTAAAAIEAMVQRGSGALTGTILAMAASQEIADPTSLASVLLQSRDPRGLVAYAALVRRRGAALGDPGQRLRELLARTESEAAAAVDALLDAKTLDDRTLADNGARAFVTDSAAADRIRAGFRGFAPAVRAEIARRATSDNALDQNAPTRQALAVLAADPEPAIRAAAIGAQLCLADADARREGMQRLLAEAGAVSWKMLERAVNRSPPTDLREDLLALPAGPQREAAYVALLQRAARDSKSDAAAVVALALARGDTSELLHALLAPTLRSRPDAVGPVGGMNVGAFLPQFGPLLIGRLAAHSDPLLGRRLAEAVAQSPEESVRERFLEFLSLSGGTVLAQGPFAGCADLLAADASPRLRSRALGRISFDLFSRESRVALITDADAGIASSAAPRVQDPETLAAAVSAVAPERLPYFFQVAQGIKDRAAVRAIYLRADPTSELARDCLETLWTAEPDLLADAIRRAGTQRTPAAARAAQILGSVAPLPDALVAQARAAASDPAHLPALARALDAAAEQVRAAVRAVRVADLVERAKRAASEGIAGMEVTSALGRELAELGAIDALAICGERVPAIAAFGYAHLGDRDRLRALIEASSDPDGLAVAAIRGGLDADVLRWTRTGRLEAARALRALADEGRVDLMAELLAPAGADTAPLTGFDSSRGLQVIDHLAAAGAAPRLVRFAETHDSADAVRALFQLRAYEPLFAAMQRWGQVGLAGAAYTEFERLTGISFRSLDGNSGWPSTHAEQDELIAKWRAALAK